MLRRIYESCTKFFEDMALIETCFCCSLAVSAGFLAIYLVITYLIAFAFELLWILEASTNLPAAAMLLCIEYFTLVLFGTLLIHGLATKNTLCLIGWMFAVTVLTFPEAGMVIYMSVQYWRIESLYGITELTCWFARILANVIEVILVQSLYTRWKEEEIVAKRLRDLSLHAVTIPRDASLNLNNSNGGALNSQFYQTNTFHNSMDQMSNIGGIKRAASTPHIWPTILPTYDNYQFCATPNEFDASIFTPTFINDLSTESNKKCQSLLDLRTIDDRNKPLTPTPLHRQFHPWMQQPTPHYTLSLGRKSHLKMPKFSSLEDLQEGAGQDGHVIRTRTGFYAQPIENFGVPIYYGPLDGPDFLIYKKQIDKLSSKNSLSNTSADDVQKYRDVAL